MQYDAQTGGWVGGWEYTMGRVVQAAGRALGQGSPHSACKAWPPSLTLVALPAPTASAGKELQRVALPVKRPTACTFGGEDLGTLFVTTRVRVPCLPQWVWLVQRGLVAKWMQGGWQVVAADEQYG